MLDEGRGVPVEARESIFERYGTVMARRSSNYHSSGLGLTFCRLAIEAHGGRIGVDDRAGGGADFWFELPLAHGASVTHGSAISTSAPAPQPALN